MFRLAVPLLVSTVASIDDDSVSLMQGMKPKEQKEDKSKAIANLMQSATNMLKNGATPDVVTFASETLASIDGTVMTAIQDAHSADQTLIDNTFRMFEEALSELADGNALAAEQNRAERDLSALHKACRVQEEQTCRDKQECDYGLWAKWQTFVEAESEMRIRSATITGLFCPPEANGTTEHFREEAVAFFDPWLQQKPIVERTEAEYSEEVPVCEERFQVLDDKTAECDASQTHLEEAACTHANTVQTVRNTFSEAWNYAVLQYQRVADEVHCLEIDRWKEWRTLKTVECLLDRTTERNGRPCDEATGEIQQELAHCEEIRSTEDISHIEINYHVPPALPAACAELPSGRCLPAVPHAPCSGGYIAQEYGDLWTPPQPQFSETNSHCNQHPECVACSLVAEVANGLTTFAANPPQVQIPAREDECTTQVPQGGQQD